MNAIQRASASGCYKEIPRRNKVAKETIQRLCPIWSFSADLPLVHSSFKLFVIALLMSACLACGPSRPVIPPGEIPALPNATTEDERYGQSVLNELTRRYPLSRDDRDINLVRDLVDRLAHAARADGATWHVFVLQDDSVVNAAATRGNYVMVWTGLLRMARSDGELATVLAHEIGHLLAGHTQPTPAEEASSIIAQTTGNIAGQVLASQGAYGAIASIAGTLISETVKAIAVNPESQRQELEADQIGFFLMADAGLDPEEALAIWSTLAQRDGGSSLQFLSSHPANEERLEALRALLPAAMERYYAHTLQRSAPSSLSKKAPPQDFPQGDSFSFGRDPLPVTPHALPPATPRSHHHLHESFRPRIWVVVEPHAPVRIAAFSDSAVVSTLHNGTSVVIKSRSGGYYEISEPVQGFVPTESISPP